MIHDQHRSKWYMRPTLSLYSYLVPTFITEIATYKNNQDRSIPVKLVRLTMQNISLYNSLRGTSSEQLSLSSIG